LKARQENKPGQHTEEKQWKKNENQGRDSVTETNQREFKKN
jgi:hypothetical protein